MLAAFPSREHSLDQHAMVANLPTPLQDSLLMFLSSVFPKSSGEVVAALKSCWERYPTSMRVKELFETVEVFRLVSKQISLLQKARGRPLTNIFDLCCGHGLLGVLLGYRFPASSVVCCDLEERDAFGHYVEAFRASGVPHRGGIGEADCMSNVAFVVGDMASLVPAPCENSFVVCVHACNEANIVALQLATAAGAGFAAMPCCVRDGLTEDSVRTHRVDDHTRHAVLCGAVAAKFGATLVTSITPGITNRSLIFFGGFEAKKC